jgi:hypothetical protein
MLLATQIENHPQECWDIYLTKPKCKDLHSKCLNYYIEKVKNLRFIEGRRERRQETAIIDQFIFCWSVQFD